MMAKVSWDPNLLVELLAKRAMPEEEIARAVESFRLVLDLLQEAAKIATRANVDGPVMGVAFAEFEHTLNIELQKAGFGAFMNDYHSGLIERTLGPAAYGQVMKAARSMSSAAGAKDPAYQ